MSTSDKIVNYGCYDDSLSKDIPIHVMVNKDESAWVRAYLNANPGIILTLRRGGKLNDAIYSIDNVLYLSVHKCLNSWHVKDLKTS